MNGKGSCSFRVWMRVFRVGRLKADTPSVCVTPNLSIHWHNWANENTLRVVFPLCSLVINRCFLLQAELLGFVPFLSYFHPHVSITLCHMFRFIIVVTGATIPLFKHKDFEKESCRRNVPIMWQLAPPSKDRWLRSTVSLPFQQLVQFNPAWYSLECKHRFDLHFHCEVLKLYVNSCANNIWCDVLPAWHRVAHQ